jgi:hemoglobin/transferrin/lactoferrin receptor protein
MPKPARLLPSVLCLFATAVVSLGAQRPATIAGTVVDPQGGGIPNAALDLTCGGERRRATGSATGAFSIAAPGDGRCRLTASSDSFEAETISVTPGDPARLVLQIRRFSSEVIVTPTRGVAAPTFDTPEATSVTSRRDIEGRPHAVLMQVLREEVGVLPQQTTSAQVSPIIRGFTGQSNVYLLDGVRLNNSSWRTGPSQYVSWVDGGPISAIEIVRGGGSVQYGSDALGGTIQMLTAPLPATLPAITRVDGSGEIRASTADEAFGVQGDIALQTRRGLFRVGASHDSMGDLRAGGGLDSHSAITRFLGQPSTLIGTRQRGTGFDQRGGYAVADVRAGRSGNVHGFFMHDSQVGASRYDRIMGGEGLFSSGFDPQTLDFGIVRYSQPDAGGFGLSASLSVNRQADGRFEQARPVARLDRQSATTTAIGYQGQAHRAIASRHQLTIGAELYDESIDGERELIEPSGLVVPSRPDIPHGTSYLSFGTFVQQAVELGSRVSARGGLRFSHFNFSTTPDGVLGVTAEDVTMRTVTFQAAAVVRVTDSLNLTANITRGFRAPNAADFGSVGLTGGGGFEIAPSRAVELGAFVGSTGAANAVSTGTLVPQLRPEVVYQYDFGAKASAGRFSGAVNVFDLELQDFIQRRSLVFDSSIVGTTIAGFTVVRQDAGGLAYIAQDVRPIATRVNIDRARVLGLDVEGGVRLGDGWSAHAYYSQSNGRILPHGEFIRRMPPPMGGARVRWDGDRMWAEGVVMFAGEQTRLNSGDLSDARIGGVRTRASIATFFNGTATDLGLVVNGVLVATGENLAAVQNRVLGTANSGTLFTTGPGFATLGLRGGIRVTPQFEVTLIGENLTDRNYRFYGSGVDAPGANLQARVRYRF